MPYKDPEAKRAYNRAYYAANRAQQIESAKARSKARYAADPARKLTSGQRWRKDNPDYAMRQRHGLTTAAKTAMLRDQAGKCYLCGDPLRLDDAFIDHDHRCCPPKYSCRRCRRGLACHPCNALIGLARDDPARLRRIASNLETANSLAEPRIALKAVQELLPATDA